MADKATNDDVQHSVRPTSAYAIFFQKTSKNIKEANPDSTFEQISDIAMKMWAIMDDNKKAEYYKQLDDLHAESESATPVVAKKLVSAATTTTLPTAPSTPSVEPCERRSMLVAGATVPATQAHSNTPRVAVVTPAAATVAPATVSQPATTVRKCTRENCNKPAIVDPEWEDEYCSSECVVAHCRNVFNQWVLSNRKS